MNRVNEKLYFIQKSPVPREYSDRTRTLLSLNKQYIYYIDFS